MNDEKDTEITDLWLSQGHTYCAWHTACQATGLKKHLEARIGEENENASGGSGGVGKDG